MDLIQGWLLDPRGHQQPSLVTNYTRLDCINQLPVLFMRRKGGEEKGNISLGKAGIGSCAWSMVIPQSWNVPVSTSPQDPVLAESKTWNKSLYKCLRSAPVFQEFLWNHSCFLHKTKRNQWQNFGCHGVTYPLPTTSDVWASWGFCRTYIL